MPYTEVILLYILTPWPMLLDPRFAEVGSACGTIVSICIEDIVRTSVLYHVLYASTKIMRPSAS